MDLKGWDGPVVGVLGTLLAAVLALVGVKARQNHKRTQSQDDLAQTENTVGAIYLSQILEDLERTKHERDEAMQQAQVNLDLYLAEKRHAVAQEIRVMEVSSEMRRQQRQITALAGVVLRYRPEALEELQHSGFASLDAPTTDRKDR